MSKRNKLANDERKKYIEELADGYSRKELDEIAGALELNSDDYPNKNAIAEAILIAREREEARGRARAQEAMDVRKVATSTVKGKMKAIEKKAADFNAFTKEEFQQGINAFQESISEQVRRNRAFIKDVFQQNLKKFHEAIQLFRQSIEVQVKEHQNYIKQFYG